MQHVIFVRIFLLVSLLFFSTAYADSGEHPPMKELAPMLKRLHALEGEWRGVHDTVDKNKDVTLEYEISSGGSVIVERMMAGSDHEMISIYHGRDEEVLMTHYCMLNNQPRMRLVSSSGNRLHFKFLDGTNLDSPNDAHMHEMVMTLQGNDKMTHEWTLYEEGKPVKTERFRFSRKG